MIKLRIATGVGLLLFMAAMMAACGPVGISRPQANDGAVTLASFAGKFMSKGSGSYTLCFRANLSALVDCTSSPHQEVPFNITAVAHNIRDAAGNSCGVTALTLTPTEARVFGTYLRD